MRILVLGGTVFLSRAIAAAAAQRGHEVVAACRGSHPLPEGVTHVPLDRTAPDWDGLDGEFDAVVETQESPAWITAALDVLADRAGHWTYVSSISVYEDTTTMGGTPATLSLREPVFDEDDSMEPAAYGGRKVACERLVAERARTHLIARPGLIIGPGDTSGRFTYWPVRLSEVAPGAEVLAPGSPDDPMQVIDVRDLAAWHVDAVEHGLTGTFDVTGPRTTMADVLHQTADGVNADVAFRWVPSLWLADHDVEPWMGPDSIPLWLPPDHGGMVSHDVTGAFVSGLTIRPWADTARDTLAWVAEQDRAGTEAPRTGISRDRELALLAALQG